jgi:hypothetical protein
MMMMMMMVMILMVAERCCSQAPFATSAARVACTVLKLIHRHAGEQSASTDGHGVPTGEVGDSMAMGGWGVAMGGILRITLLSATRTHYMSSDVGLRSWAEGRPGSRHTMDDGDDDDDDDDDGDDDDDDDVC